MWHALGYFRDNHKQRKICGKYAIFLLYVVFFVGCHTYAILLSLDRSNCRQLRCARINCDNVILYQDIPSYLLLIISIHWKTIKRLFSKRSCGTWLINHYFMLMNYSSGVWSAKARNFQLITFKHYIGFHFSRRSIIIWTNRILLKCIGICSLVLYARHG